MKKIYIIKYIPIILIFLSLSVFLKEHFSLDTYCVVNSGYIEYAKLFTTSGRFISASLLIILQILKIPYKLGITLFSFGAICIYLLACIKIYEHLENKKNNFILLLTTLMLGFNFCTLQTFAYFENISMAIGFYLGVKGAITIISKDKYKYIKAIIILCIGFFAYQGTVSIFIPLVILFWLVENRNDNNFPKFSVHLIKAAIVYIIACVTNLIAIKFMKNIFNVMSRVEGNLDIKASILFPIKSIRSVIIESGGMMKPYIFSIFLICTICIMIYNFILKFKKENKIKIFKNIGYIFILGIAVYISGFLPGMAMPKEAHTAAVRLLPSIGASISIIYIYIYKYIKIDNKKIEKILVVIMVMWFVINLINNIYISNENVKTLEFTKQLSKKIKNEIVKYETENKTKVIKAVRVKMSDMTFYKDTTMKNELNINPYTVDWVSMIPLKIFENPVSNYGQILENELNFKIKRDEVRFVDNIMYIGI